MNTIQNFPYMNLTNANQKNNENPDETIDKNIESEISN